ncbi:glycosyltransferase [Oleiharenicola lentus]|uniref:glycosyltransferase n=1 Tax=Oleiharenicola lentus TaxID=2508720 RepID=UPI003F6669AE
MKTEKILTIAIPTFNRVRELAALSKEFITPVLDLHEDYLEVIVCDNSSAENSVKNKSFLDNRVRYYPNTENVGFSGNIIHCINRAEGKYLWIVSDDDPIQLENFNEAFDVLRGGTCVECLMLPYDQEDHLGRIISSNRGGDWGFSGEVALSDLLATGRMPFILLSSAILKLDKKCVESLEGYLRGNDYLHSILFLKMLRADSRVAFFDRDIVRYTCDHAHGRVSITSMAESLAGFRRFLSERFSTPLDPRGDYGGWLLWMIHHRGGLYRLKDADAERWVLLSQLPKNLTLKNLILALAILLPPFLLRPFYLVYRAKLDARNAEAPLSFREAFKLNYKFTSKILKTK